MSTDDFFTRLNPVFRAVLRSPLHWLVSPGLMLLTFTGRKTGREYTIPVGYQKQPDGAIVVMISEAWKKQWWRNCREPAPVSLRLRGRDLRGTATLVAPGSDDHLRLAERTMQRVPVLDRSWGLRYDRKRGLTPGNVAYLTENIGAVRIVLDA